ncbi:MAG: radical SAM protein [Deltaproteobacteria bacterium]|nr:radical SAM protein [Deltaproteobacteria bacterium]
MSLATVNHPPGGQAILLAANDRYLGLLAARYGQRFLDYRKAWAEASGRRPVGPFPLSVDLAVNSGCQLSCAMCPLPSRPAFRRYEPMAQNLYARLMAQAAEYRLPALTMGLASEPLLNPLVPELIAVADRAGVMDIRLGTNGAALTENSIQRLLDTNLTRLEISVDAFEAQAYQIVRPGGDFERLCKSIELFLTFRAKKNLIFPLLRLSFLTLPHNQHQLEPFLARWSSQVDLISVQKPIWFPGTKIARPAHQKRPPAKAKAEKTSTLELPGPDNCSQNAASGQLNLIAGSTEAQTQTGWCVQPWQRLGIDHLGRVWPCCSWYGEKLIELSAAALPIAQIWQSQELENLRRSQIDGRPPEACQLCAENGAF